MDIKHIRQLLREGSQVVLVEDGETPLVVRELRPEETPQEVPIASRWPKGRTTVFDGRTGAPADPVTRQDQILERLNKEILALREQIAQDS